MTPDQIKELGFAKDPYDGILTMEGNFPYNKEEIVKRVIKKDGKGNYRTGEMDQMGRFIPRYVGRGIVFNRLNDHLDEGFKDAYFQFRYENSEIKSYEIESADYDYFGVLHKQLRNAEHPKRPDCRADLKCPYCGK